MKNFNMNAARNTLRATMRGVQPAAEDFINWDEFEAEIDELMAKNPSAILVKQLFARTITRARQAYHEAMLTGVAGRVREGVRRERKH